MDEALHLMRDSVRRLERQRKFPSERHNPTLGAAIFCLKQAVAHTAGYIKEKGEENA